MRIIWKAYENDGVDIGRFEGYETAPEAIAACAERWQDVCAELGNDNDFDFYVQNEKVNSDGYTEAVLKEITVTFNDEW